MLDYIRDLRPAKWVPTVILHSNKSECPDVSVGSRSAEIRRLRHVRPALNNGLKSDVAALGLRAVRPANLHITPDFRCDLVHAASAAGSL
jgi:hypothetical protein